VAMAGAGGGATSGELRDEARDERAAIACGTRVASLVPIAAGTSLESKREVVPGARRACAGTVTVGCYRLLGAQAGGDALARCIGSGIDGCEAGYQRA